MVSLPGPSLSTENRVKTKAATRITRKSQERKEREINKCRHFLGISPIVNNGPKRDVVEATWIAHMGQRNVCVAT